MYLESHQISKKNDTMANSRNCKLLNQQQNFLEKQNYNWGKYGEKCKDNKQNNLLLFSFQSNSNYQKQEQSEINKIMFFNSCGSKKNIFRWKQQYLMYLKISVESEGTLNLLVLEEKIKLSLVFNLAIQYKRSKVKLFPVIAMTWKLKILCVFAIGFFIKKIGNFFVLAPYII